MLPNLLRFSLALSLLVAAGCASEDIPQAYRGRLFDRTGPLAFYGGGKGLTGPVLGPGTYFTKTYNELRMVDCSTVTMGEPLQALTQDGVQFGLHLFVRFSADCSDAATAHLLETLTPDQDHAVTWKKIYVTFVQPAIGEAVREVISPYRAEEINDKREAILAAIRRRFVEIMTEREKNNVIVYEVNLSNLEFPEQMNTANTERAVQAILKDKAVAERERVTAEIETMKMRRELSQREGEKDAAKIDIVGAALRRNPEYLQFDLQARMPEIYRAAGAGGNLIIAAPEPSLLVATGSSAARGRAVPLIPPTSTTPARPAAALPAPTASTTSAPSASR